MTRKNIEREVLTYDVLTRMIIEALASKPDMHFPHVHVEVDDGIVTLSGRVESVSEKSAAEDAASHVPDVTQVINDIQVMPPSLLDDNAIANAVRESLERDVRLDSKFFEILVNQGTVDIRGEVITEQDKLTALDNVRGTYGVFDVVDHISVLPGQSSSDHILEDDITAAIERTSGIDDKNIKVHVANNIVYLGGETVTEYQKKELEEVVSRIPGVYQISNHVIVQYHHGG